MANNREVGCRGMYGKRNQKGMCVVNKNARKKITVYLAGPLFSQAERLWNKALADYIESRPGSPFTVNLPQETTPVEKGDAAIYRHCRRSVETCDILLAGLDGPDVDSGTAWEVGYAMGIGKPTVAYRTDFRFCEGNNHVNIMLLHGHEAFVTAVQANAEQHLAEADGTFGRIYSALMTVAKKRFRVGEARKK